MSTILLILLVTNIGVITFHIVGQLYTLYAKYDSNTSVVTNNTDKVTIHVPIHNEPPELVKETLRCLENLNYENYEVIVLDNNTPDPSLYLPISSFCATREKFTFYHYDAVTGYKAGALNLCNELSDIDTKFYLIIDADYCVTPDIIQKGLAEFSSAKVGLVQFPQSYRNNRDSDCSLMMDYSYYFDLVLNKANQFNCPLPTGTLTFIRKETLDKLGGWKVNSVTEDAELGIHLYENQYQIKYVPKVVGKGLAPYDYKTLRKQRNRWIYGNFQILLTYLKSPKTLDLSFLYGIFLQLTAWLNFAGLSFVLAIFSSALHIISPLERFDLLQTLALGGVITHLVGKLLLYVVYAFKTPHYSLLTALKAWLIHLCLMYDGAFCWWKLLLGKKIAFVTTNKFNVSTRSALSYHAFAIPLLLFVHLVFLNIGGHPVLVTIISVLLFLYCLAPILFINTVKTNQFVK